MSMVKNLWNFI